MSISAPPLFPTRPLRALNPVGAATLSRRRFVQVTACAADLVATATAATGDSLTSGPVFGVPRWDLAAGRYGLLDVTGPAEVEALFDSSRVYASKPTAIGIKGGVPCPDVEGFASITPISSTQQSDGTWRVALSGTYRVAVALGQIVKASAPAGALTWARVAWYVTGSAASPSDRTIAEITDAAGTGTGTLIWVDALASNLRSLPQDGTLFAVQDTGQTVTRTPPCGGTAASHPLYVATGPTTRTGTPSSAPSTSDALVSYTPSSGLAAVGATVTVGGQIATLSLPISSPYAADGSTLSGSTARTVRCAPALSPLRSCASALVPSARRVRIGKGNAAKTDAAGLLRFRSMTMRNYGTALAPVTTDMAELGQLTVEVGMTASGALWARLSYGAEQLKIAQKTVTFQDYGGTSRTCVTIASPNAVAYAPSTTTQTGSTLTTSSQNLAISLTTAGQSDTLTVAAYLTSSGLIAATVTLASASALGWDWVDAPVVPGDLTDE